MSNDNSKTFLDYTGVETLVSNIKNNFYNKSEVYNKPEIDNIIASYPTGQPKNEIWYTTNDDNIITPYNTNAFDVTIISNEYKNGRGIIKFDDDVTVIGTRAFFGCNSLTSVTMPNSITTIGEYAFSKCNSLSDIIFSNNIISFGESSFSNCFSLKSVIIPDNTVSIGMNAFYNCTSLENIIIPNSVTELNGPFSSCTSLTSITIPDSVTSIGAWGFMDCVMLKNIMLPNNITSIGKGTFYGCTALTSVTIPDSVTSIGECAFYNCTSLTSITIPDSVTEIGVTVFDDDSGYTSLADIYCKSTTPPIIQFSTLASNIKTIYVPNESLDAYKSATNWSRYADKMAGIIFEDEHLVSGQNIKTINGNNILGSGDIKINVDKLEKISYNELNNLKENADLTPGIFYRITDYECITTATNTQSANHPFDIIVQALDEKTLSENARAIQRDSDEYFTDSNLNTWKLKYNIDNDTSRFSWAKEEIKEQPTKWYCDWGVLEERYDTGASTNYELQTIDGANWYLYRPEQPTDYLEEKVLYRYNNTEFINITDAETELYFVTDTDPFMEGASEMRVIHKETGIQIVSWAVQDDTGVDDTEEGNGYYYATYMDFENMQMICEGDSIIINGETYYEWVPYNNDYTDIDNNMSYENPYRIPFLVNIQNAETELYFVTDTDPFMEGASKMRVIHKETGIQIDSWVVEDDYSSDNIEGDYYGAYFYISENDGGVNMGCYGESIQINGETYYKWVQYESDYTDIDNWVRDNSPFNAPSVKIYYDGSIDNLYYALPRILPTAIYTVYYVTDGNHIYEYEDEFEEEESMLDTISYSSYVAPKEGGKGVIYEMIDEYNNRCPYDFKNIQFKHTDGNWYYTFNYSNTDISKNYNINCNCKNNIIKNDYKESSLPNIILNFIESNIYCCGNQIINYKTGFLQSKNISKNIFNNFTQYDSTLNIISNQNIRYNNINGCGNIEIINNNGAILSNTFELPSSVFNIQLYITGAFVRNTFNLKGSWGGFTFNNGSLKNCYIEDTDPGANTTINPTLELISNCVMSFCKIKLSSKLKIEYANTTSSALPLTNLNINAAGWSDETITIPSAFPVNSNYELKVAKNSIGEIKMWCDADLIQ